MSDAEAHALLDALGSDDECVRHLAGTLIGRSGDHAFVPDLLEHLKSQSAASRAGAARVLGLLNDRGAVERTVNFVSPRRSVASELSQRCLGEPFSGGRTTGVDP